MFFSVTGNTKKLKVFDSVVIFLRKSFCSSVVYMAGLAYPKVTIVASSSSELDYLFSY